MTDPRSPVDWAAIALGGAIGAVLRGLLVRVASTAPDRAGRALDPALATLVANLVGCALLGGWTAAANSVPPLVPGGSTGALSAFATLGVCGSLSTFSTLCGDAVRLARAGPRGRAIGYLLAHLVGGPVALAGGAWLLR